jgi:hypothetical protein
MGCAMPPQLPGKAPVAAVPRRTLATTVCLVCGFVIAVISVGTLLVSPDIVRASIFVQKLEPTTSVPPLPDADAPLVDAPAIVNETDRAVAKNQTTPGTSAAAGRSDGERTTFAKSMSNIGADESLVMKEPKTNVTASATNPSNFGSGELLVAKEPNANGTANVGGLIGISQGNVSDPGAVVIGISSGENKSAIDTGNDDNVVLSFGAIVRKHLQIPDTEVRLDSKTHKLIVAGAPVPDFASGVLPAGSDYVNKWIVSDMFSYKSPLLEGKGYVDISEAQLAQHRRADLAGTPTSCANRRNALAVTESSASKSAQAQCPEKVPFLLQFSNVWVDHGGRVLVPKAADRGLFSSQSKARSVSVFEVGGGCCERHWSLTKKEKTMSVKLPPQSKRNKVGLVLSQHHGMTYYHILAEVLPRLLVFWKVSEAGATANMSYVVSSRLASDIISAVGLDQERIMILKENEFVFFERLFVPSPVNQDPAFVKERQEVSTAHVLVDSVKQRRMSKVEVTQPKATGKPTLLVMERALGRHAVFGTCIGNRCMENYDEVFSTLAEEFGELLDVRRFSSTDSNLFEQSVLQFAESTIIIGVHGAGFNNVVFMGGEHPAYAIHLEWDGTMWRMYDAIARRHGVSFRNVITPVSGHKKHSLVVDVSVIVLEVWRILEAENIPGIAAERALRDKARGWPLDPARNSKAVVMWNETSRSMYHPYKR